MFFDKYKNIVIKIGTSSIYDDINQVVRHDWLRSFVKDLEWLRQLKLEIILVVSGAVTLGAHMLGIKREKIKQPEKRYCSTVGQLKIMRLLEDLFKEVNINIAQFLISIDDFEDRIRSMNLRNSINSIVKANFIPIINENDLVVLDSIRFQDNDRLASRVAQLLASNLLIIISDIEGLYNKNPHLFKDAKLIKNITKITDDLYRGTEKLSTSVGTGGMKSKLLAADMVMNAGCDMVIVNSKYNNVLQRLSSENFNYSFFKGYSKSLGYRKLWMMNLHVKGEIIIDKGAEKALLLGASLLPSGVVDFKGTFLEGDTVVIKNTANKILAKGLIEVNYKEMKEIMGKNTQEISNILSYKIQDALIHRSYMVIF